MDTAEGWRWSEGNKAMQRIWWWVSKQSLLEQSYRKPPLHHITRTVVQSYGRTIWNKSQLLHFCEQDWAKEDKMWTFSIPILSKEHSWALQICIYPSSRSVCFMEHRENMLSVLNAVCQDASEAHTSACPVQQQVCLVQAVWCSHSF